MKEPVVTWLPRLWDMGVNGISMPAVKARKVNPSLLKEKAETVRGNDLPESLGTFGYFHLKSPPHKYQGLEDQEGTKNKRSCV